MNGVAFFNENAVPGHEIVDELFNFDKCSGHPQNRGMYHYHVKTANLGGVNNPVFWITNKYYFGEPGVLGQ